MESYFRVTFRVTRQLLGEEHGLQVQTRASPASGTPLSASAKELLASDAMLLHGFEMGVWERFVLA